MDALTVSTYLSYFDNETIERLRTLIRSFSEEDINKLKIGQMKITIHLVGKPQQQEEDLQYFQEISETEGIPLTYNYKKKAVTLGKYRND